MLIPFLAVGCGGQKKEAANKEIAVTIEPLRFFADKIAGGDYKFFSLVPVGQSPESYDPSPREMIRAGQGIACFYLGRFAVEKSLVKAIKENNAGTYIRDLSEGLPTERLHTDGLSVGELHTGEAGESGHSGHSGVDPHIWSYFEGAKTISENIFKALSSLDTARSDFYASNYQNFTNELAALESSLHEQLDTLSRRGFVIYHPALTYFAKEFGLTQYSIEEDGKEPSPSSLKHLIEEAKKAEVKVVFVQMEFDRKHAEQIAKEIGANVVVINPLDYQWDEQMKLIAKALIRNGEID
ncbi:MAG: zinc ABC transporter substrate-binding protein [Tannerella sp.]|nr:zinc ABC transporter substrate-binding protein [Tannerella sp.]